jgi:hypothetical protein
VNAGAQPFAYSASTLGPDMSGFACSRDRLGDRHANYRPWAPATR